VLCIDEVVRQSQFPDVLRQGDTLQISCAVDYTGVLAPGFTWSPSPDRTLPPTDTGSTVTSTVQVTSDDRFAQRYTCSVSFNGSILGTAPFNTSARPNGEYNYAEDVHSLFSALLRGHTNGRNTGLARPFVSWSVRLSRTAPNSKTKRLRKPTFVRTFPRQGQPVCKLSG